jgi:hypothetical protein
MKEKIVGIFVCMLVLATAMPAVMSIKNSGTAVLEHPLINGRMKAPLNLGNEFFTNKESNTKVPSHPLPSMGGGWNWTQTQKLTITGGRAALFGEDIAIDGDTALISAPYEDNYNGSVYVYTCTGANWTQQQKLTPSDPGVDDTFGVRVALQGDTALIGADDEISQDSPGAVYVFTRAGTTWTQSQKLTAPGGTPFDVFAVPALDGDTAVISAPYDDDKGVDAGALYVYTRTGTTWTEQTKLYASDPLAGEWFGWEVSLDGDTAVATTYDWWNDTVNPGAAYVFTRTGTMWTQQAKLVGSDTVPGDTFGYDVSLSGDTVIVGAVNDDDNGDYSGSAFVFTRTGTTWTQEAKLLPSDGRHWAWFGTSVYLEGNTALIGAADDYCPYAGQGSAYVFTRTGTTWTQQQKLRAADGKTQDNFGLPVRLGGNTAFIGAWYDPASGTDSGSVYVFIKPTFTFNITGGFGVNLKITNNGTINATGVPWQLQVKGGLLGRINKTVNGTIDIPAGQSKTVGMGMFFGFGALTITAKVADEEQTKKGTQILVFSIVKK